MRHERLAQKNNKEKVAVWPIASIGWVKNKTHLIFIVVAVAALLILSIALAVGGKSPRSEAYADTSGAAGLSAVINYTCTDTCEDKYNFNVYILTPDGRQVSTIQPNSDGEVKLAMAEGSYLMLIGKLFDNQGTFPQERLELKDGKTLELEVNY